MKHFSVLLLCLLLILPACSDDDDPTPTNNAEEGFEVGQQALEFSLADQNGEMKSLSDYRGKIVLLEFWSILCDGCKRQMPEVERLWNDHRDKDFVIIGLSDDVDEQGWKDFVTATGESGFARDWIQLHDSFLQPNIFSKYSVSKTPTRFLLDKDGIILFDDLDEVAMRVEVETALGLR